MRNLLHQRKRTKVTSKSSWVTLIQKLANITKEMEQQSENMVLEKEMRDELGSYNLLNQRT